MKKMILTAMIVAAFSGIVFAGPVDMKDVSPDAKIVIHVDMESLRASTLGKALMAELKKDKPAELKEIEAVLGNDVLMLVDSVTMYAKDAEGQTAVGVAKGDFDVAKIEQLIAETEELEAKKGKHGKTTIYDVTIIEEEDADEVEAEADTGALEVEIDVEPEGFSFAIAGDSLVVAKDSQQIKKALDVITKAEAGDVNRFSSLRNQVSNTILAVECDDASVIKFGGENSPEMVKKLAAAIVENDGKLKLDVDVETFKAEQATQMQQMIQGLMMMAMMSQESPQPELMALVQAIKIKAEGPKLAIDVEYPANKLIALFENGDPLEVTAPTAAPEPAASQQ